MTDKRVTLFGLPVDALTMEETLERIEHLLASQPDTVHQHVVVNAAKVVAAQDDEVLRDAITSASIINADGMSVVWASRLLGCPLPERVTGIDLMAELVAWAEGSRHSIYLLGARPEVVEAVRTELLKRHPGLRIAGVRDGYWTPEEEPGVVARIARSRADLLFVALPSPSKELFVAGNRAALNVGLVMGVGGSFDVLAGRTRRAPQWMQRTGLEWFYRLIQEPRRMLARYLVGNLHFLLLLSHAAWRRVVRQRGRDAGPPDGST